MGSGINRASRVGLALRGSRYKDKELPQDGVVHTLWDTGGESLPLAQARLDSQRGRLGFILNATKCPGRNQRLRHRDEVWTVETSAHIPGPARSSPWNGLASDILFSSHPSVRSLLTIHLMFNSPPPSLPILTSLMPLLAVIFNLLRNLFMYQAYH